MSRWKERHRASSSPTNIVDRRRPLSTTQMAQFEPSTPGVPEPQSGTGHYVAAEIVCTFVQRHALRWRALVGCRIRLVGRGFGEVKRVDAASTLWVLFESATGEQRPSPTELEAITPAFFERGQVAGVIFPPQTASQVLRTLDEIRESSSLPKRTTVSPGPSVAKSPAHSNAQPQVRSDPKQKANAPKPNAPQPKAKSPQRSGPKLQVKPPERSDPKQKPIRPRSQAQVEQVHLGSIAQLRKLLPTEAYEFVVRIQSLCVQKPCYAAIAAACRQLAYERPTERAIAVRASELEGWSRRNVKPGSDEPGYNGQSQTLQSSSVTGRSKAGPKKIDRKNNDQQKINISKFGDWESD